MLGNRSIICSGIFQKHPLVIAEMQVAPFPLIRWVPAHHGVLGNEAASEHAKAAAEGEEPSDAVCRFVFPIFVSVLLCSFCLLKWGIIMGRRRKRGPTLMAWHWMALWRIAGWGQEFGYNYRAILSPTAESRCAANQLVLFTTLCSAIFCSIGCATQSGSTKL